MTSSTTCLALIARAQQHGERVAILDSQGSFTYNDLLEASARVARALLAGRADLREERVAYLLTPGFPWVATLWGIWRAGGIAVPLPLNSAKPELEYVIEDTRASTILFDAAAAPLLLPMAEARGLDKLGRAISYEQLFAASTVATPLP